MKHKLPLIHNQIPNQLTSGHVNAGLFYCSAFLSAVPQAFQSALGNDGTDGSPNPSMLPLPMPRANAGLSPPEPPVDKLHCNLPKHGT